ncbi:hypothetical protein [Kineobactrum salinum]|uniref:Uncharacterized protein n=1 Tax=Kineobactrum salinum TaxID=2708301 RepID=A0A6C0TZS4_9GAMM|nr:hypothetical protein [Kineobactrum salinum]QIB65158.1 hypothetical protein G3T16_06810 [Kineobactrum salinum]
MSKLQTDLLADFHPLAREGRLNATLEGHGLYNTFHFVLRLSPVVHRKLASMPSGIVNSGMIDLDGVKAFSTYLHETVHWWQHIGSTYGLMLSTTYPAQAHANYDYLKGLITKVGFKKSIRKLAESLPGGGVGTPRGLANIVINNHFDMNAYRDLTISPLSGNEIVQSPLFESPGHCYHIAYGNIVSLLASVSDRNHRIIPHPKHWSKPFRELRERKEEGYFAGSRILLYPIGAYEIFEGQARMAQLQYLHFATGGVLGLDAADKAKMFDGVYGEAFSTFLHLTELERPSSIDHPTIALFLLICDLAINPGSGFPFPLVHFKTFIRDIEPGARFVCLCRMARLKCPEVLGLVRDYSREEYKAISEKLCGAMVEHPPLEIAQELSLWTDAPEFSSLMTEYETFRFEKSNVAVRILFSHFLAFMRDKFMRAEFFCWPGVYMAGDKLAPDAMTLFDRHGALFVDKEDDDGVYPRLLSGRSENDVQEAFDDFYGSNVIYDLTRQWIVQAGSFRYYYRWLSQKGSDEQIQSFAERSFESVYGVKPSQVVVL